MEMPQSAPWRWANEDLVVCDVADDAAAALETIEKMRSTEGYAEIPAVLIAESRWAGLEKKAEACLRLLGVCSNRSIQTL